MHYDIREFFKFSGLYPGNVTYEVPQLQQIWIYCRGERSQLAQMMAPTPFTLQDDIFVIGVGDFSKGTGWADASIVLPILFDGKAGGNYYFEYEDQHASVASGREVWGYSKALAKIDWINRENGIDVKVHDYEQLVFSFTLDYEDDLDCSNWAHLALYPQYQVRAVPEIAGPSFAILDVVTRDPSLDYTPHRTLLARAKVEMGKVDLTNNILGGEKLKLLEILGAEVRIGDYRSTLAHGVPQRVRSLL